MTNPPEQNWPCDRLIIHGPHESADGSRKCMGITNEEYIRHVMPALKQCDEFATHLPHGNCPGKESTEEREPVRARMPEARCLNFQMHAAHRWSDDRGLNYSWCKGLDAMTAALISTKEVPDIILSVEHTHEIQCPLFRTPGKDVPLHEPHTWTANTAAGFVEYSCPGSSEETSPPKWEYHVEKHEDGSYLVVKKRGDGFDPNWESKVAKYNNGVYARIVADALNGGAILGFEV
jgi:hypothetical protein